MSSRADSRLAWTGDGDWHWWQPPEGERRLSASSRLARNNKKRRKRNRQQVLERDGHICTYCGEEATTTDHIISVAKGGTDDLENQTAACEPCNKTLGWLGL
jgi:hypothetical protein